MPNLNRRDLLSRTVMLSAAAALAACSEQDARAALPSATSLSAQKAYELAAQGNGFTTGSLMAANTAYVFFDTTCPHCAHLWEAAKPLQNRVKVVWMPLAFLRPISLTQGAAILAAAKPAEAMAENERRVLAHESAIAAATPPDESALNKVKANTALFEKLGVESVPLLVYRHARTGEYGSQTGASDTDGLIRLLGL
jgi:thiol:disulfide interchange protein DsbG